MAGVGFWEIRRVVRGVATIVRVLPRVSARWFVVFVLTTTSLVVCTVGSAFANAAVVRAVPSVLQEGSQSSSWHAIVRALWFLGALFLLRSCATYIGAMGARTLARRLDGHLRERVMIAAIAPSGIGHLEDPTMSAAFDAARNLSPLGLTPGAAVVNLGSVLSRRIEMLCFVAIIAWHSWWIGIGMLALFVIGNAEMYRLLMTQVITSRFVQPPREAGYYRDMSLTPAAAKEIRVFGLDRWLVDRYSQRQRAYLRDAWGRRKLFGWTTLLMRVVSAGMAIISFTYFGFAAIRGSIDLGDLALLITATLTLTPQVLPEDIAVSYGATVIPRIAEAEQLSQMTTTATAPSTAMARPLRSIRFEDVTFRYPHSSTDILRGLDLELRAGERTALVGVNGAGKTTIVKLLCGLYHPTSGRIVVDGHELSTVDPLRWHGQLAVLFQDFVRYELSARDNVSVGRDTADDQLWRVAGRVGADRIVESLPAGWDTPLSPHLAGGVDLSGGEWQRLAFSRALLAVERGARVLVLDEPTANLDVRAEAALYEQLIDLTESPDPDSALVTLLVSHRLSTIRRADRIVVIGDGSVLEDGTHDELMAQGGRYAGMFTAQASRFAEDAP